MKKHFVSWKPADVKWLQWGAQKLRQNTSTRNYVPEDEVVVTVNPAQDSVRVLRLPSRYFFGFKGSVAMRCWCRTATQVTITPEQPAQTVLQSAVETTFPGGGSTTYTHVITKGGTTVFSNVGVASLTPNGNGTFTVEYTNVYVSGLGLGFVFIGITGSFAPALPIPLTGSPSGSYLVSGSDPSYTDSWGSPSITAVPILNNGELDPIPAVTKVFLSDGTVITEAPDDVCNSGSPDVALLGDSETRAKREKARRKRCSDAQLMYLRSGIISPEIEALIRTQHPRSAKVVATYPMTTVTAYSTTFVDEAPPNAYSTSRLYTSTYTIRYSVPDAEGRLVPREQTFTGTARRVTETVTDANSSENQTFITTYTDFPVLVSSTGTSSPSSGLVTDITPSVSLTLKQGAGRLYVHDSSGYMPLIANGTTVSGYADAPTSQFSIGGDFAAGITTGLVSPLEELRGPHDVPVRRYTYDVTFTHPPFIKTYLKDSPPVDTTGTSLTPSTSWLSSRLSDGEVLTVVPLLFMVGDEEYGMYPSSRTDPAITDVAVRGYARIKYRGETNALEFVSWTEFTTSGSVEHDGNAAYNDEVVPTTVFSGGEQYVLAAKKFPHQSVWATDTTVNCVVVADRAVWTDTEELYKTQKKRTKKDYEPPSTELPLTPEEKLYAAVREVLY